MKNSKQYWKILLLIAIFYGIPAIQFLAYQLDTRAKMGLTYLEEECYFNFKCNQKVGSLWAFNNIISNIFYIILGIIYLFIIKLSSDENRYIVEDKNIYYSLGICLMLQGVFSAVYHVCPSAINFQFDTTFMFVGSGLLLICILQKRRPSKVIGIFKAFGLMALSNVLNVLDLSEHENINLFWTIVIVIFIILIFLFSIGAYHGNNNIYSGIRTLFFDISSCSCKFTQKKMFLIISGLVCQNIMILIISASLQLHFSTFLLALIFANIMITELSYFYYKYKHNEKIGKFNLLLIVLTIGTMITSIYFFELPCTNKFLTPSESKALNTPCILFNYFDNHDVWHMFSAFGTFGMLLTVWTIDHRFNQKQKTNIYSQQNKNISAFNFFERLRQLRRKKCINSMKDTLIVNEHGETIANS